MLSERDADEHPPAASSRIDLVLIHGRVFSQAARLVGNVPFAAVPPLWASDHFGVVARLRVH